MEAEKLKQKMITFYEHSEAYFQNLLNNFKLNGQLNISYGKELLEAAKSSSRILDCGCGHGGLSVYLSYHLRKAVSGVDVSPVALRMARRLARRLNVRCTFKQADIEKRLPFPSNYFSLVIMLHVIEHLTSPEKALREVARVLKPNGLAILISPNLTIRKASPKVLVQKIRDAISMLLDKDVIPITLITPNLERAFEPDQDAVYLTNPWEIRRMLSKAGLKIVKHIPFTCRIIAQK